MASNKIRSKSELGVASGDATYLAKAAALKMRLESQIHASYKLSESALQDLPLDVTNIPDSCGLLSADELAITELDATAVCDRIARGELTALETVTAFGKRAAIAHQLVNCLTDYFLDEGIARAKELDDYYRREGKTVGPLHGLPISIKDHIPVKGRWGSCGFLATVEISEEDCDMTSILRSLGAVFYVKTNQPQSIMHLETHSVYGRTLNPYNTNLTPGGSSGGEAALLAMKGSCIGVGTDGGGSIRNPCANCSLYGMRPTCKTMPTEGYLWYEDGNDGFYTSTAAMCHSARDVDMFISAVRSAQPSLRDPTLIPMPWHVPSSLGTKKLRVGVMMHDGVVLPHPPMLRALEQAKAKLIRSAEVEVVEYLPYEHSQGYDIIREIYFGDGGAAVRKLLKEGGEDILPLTEWVISPPHTKDHDATSLWALHDLRDEFRRAYARHWNSTGCDVLLCPPFPGTANLHDTARYWGYTAIWNLLDYPGIVFPSGLKLDPALDTAKELTNPMSEADKYNFSIYDPKAMIGAPISLQLVSRRFDDCMLLAAQKIVERIVKT